jgi:hypothetical protein
MHRCSGHVTFHSEREYNSPAVRQNREKIINMKRMQQLSEPPCLINNPSYHRIEPFNNYSIEPTYNYGVL